MVYTRPPAPPELRIVESFCNSAERLKERDALGDGHAARAWMADAGLGGAADLDEAGAAELRALREALRDHLAGVGGPKARELLNRASGAYLGPPRWAGEAEEPRLRGEGEPAGAGAVAGAVLEALARGEFTGRCARLKVCAAHECRWVFFDRSPANSGSWCSMQICGARHKMRSYRDRGRGQASAR